jgi:hypothetical protein
MMTFFSHLVAFALGGALTILVLLFVLLFAVSDEDKKRRFSSRSHLDSPSTPNQQPPPA